MTAIKSIIAQGLRIPLFFHGEPYHFLFGARVKRMRGFMTMCVWTVFAPEKLGMSSLGQHPGKPMVGSRSTQRGCAGVAPLYIASLVKQSDATRRGTFIG